jgi:hypothetical protein
MSFFKNKGKTGKAEKPVTKTLKMERNGPGAEETDKPEILSEKSEKLEKTSPVKQSSENTTITPVFINKDLKSKAPRQAPKIDITPVKRSGPQKEKIFEIKKLNIGEEFPEALVTAGRQHESEIEPDNSTKTDDLNPKEDAESAMTPDSPSPSTGLNLEKELDINLIIASAPWTDKLLPFQTNVWDSKHEEDELLTTTSTQELIQLYVDIGLANNIVWMATEFGHRSKELDESYAKLCKNIAERINYIQTCAPHGKPE